MSKYTIVALVIGLVIGATGAILLAPNTQTAGFTDEYNFKSFQGGVTVPYLNISATTATLGEDVLGGVVTFNNASGTTATLPPAKAGGVITFVTGTAPDTNNNVIDSAEGDNIEGLLEVNAADVACSGEDQIDMASTTATVGDFVKLASDGSSWYIVGSAVDTAAGATCTDPS